jgi:hypothetical protein
MSCRGFVLVPTLAQVHRQIGKQAADLSGRV